jgi:hypothetical protein
MNDFFLDAEAEYKEPEYKILETGWHEMRIESVEKKTTKNGGEMVCLKLSRTFDNARISYNVNTRNSNPVAEQIGRSQLSKVSLACGYPKLESLNQLIGYVLQFKVNVKTSEQYGDQNNVLDVKCGDGKVVTKDSTVKKSLF